MRISVAQINTSLGDFAGNTSKIIQYIEQSAARKAQLIVFPECTIFGYHPFDLLERTEVVDAQIKQIARIQKSIPEGVHVLVGLITRNPSKLGRPYFNSACLLTKKGKPRFFHKTLLPTGDVFDEARFIENGDMKNNYFSIGKKRFFLSICEDIWAWPNEKGLSSYKENPIAKLKTKKVDLVINMSASPFFVGKMKQRHYVTQKTAQKFKAPLLYVNLVGAQDEIIFDGGSFVINPKGKVLMNCHQFVEDQNTFDLDTFQSWSPVEKLSNIEQLRQALVLGIRDFCAKTNLSNAHLGLSGGIDSAVVACLLVDALGPNKVSALGLPGPFSDKLSLELATKLAKNLKIKITEVSISEMYKNIFPQIQSALSLPEFGIVNENLQARLRGMVLMAHANHTNSLLVTTGNKSEYATGYATMYGDMCGGLAPIADLTKQQVYELAKLYNDSIELIPEAIISRAPTAELRPNQKDQDSLPAYDLLDQAVVNIVELGKPAKTATEKWLLPILMKTEFKRWQAPPVLKVSKHSFGRGRRFPIAIKA